MLLYLRPQQASDPASPNVCVLMCALTANSQPAGFTSASARRGKPVQSRVKERLYAESSLARERAAEAARQRRESLVAAESLPQLSTHAFRGSQSTGAWYVVWCDVRRIVSGSSDHQCKPA